jgi:hypothetical protein
MEDELIIELNHPQILVHTVNANKTVILWGRAGGKTNGVWGPRIEHIFEKMPGCQMGFIVPTYEMGAKNIIPNIIGFWENQMGLVEGEDFVNGIKPPDEWDKPIIPVPNYKNCITRSNGCVLVMLSLAVEGAGNGFNLQSLGGDEGKFFDEKKVNEIRRALRGCQKQFGHLPEYLSEWYSSDKYGGDINWMLRQRENCDDKLIKSVVTMQQKVDDLKQSKGNKEKIKYYNDLLIKIRKNLTYVSEASSYENIENLGEKYFEDQRKISTPLEFSIAIENKDPDKVEHSFYPNFREHHYYNLYNDVDPTLPLIIAADYQWRISPIVQAQYRLLPGTDIMSLNFNYSCHTVAPLGLIEAVDKWCYHNRGHQNKLVYYVFDKTATVKSSTSAQPYVSVSQRLQQNGWQVVEINTGDQPKHDAKFKSINNRLKDEANHTPIRINTNANKDLIASINNTAAKSLNGKTAKDKSAELNKSIPAVKTTHYSDTFDMIIHADDLGVITAESSNAFFPTVYN